MLEKRIESYHVLTGLTGVVIGQIGQSSLRGRVKTGLTIALTSTFALAILAVGFAIDWFPDPIEINRTIAIVFFTGQLLLFSLAVPGFWLRA